MTAIGLTLPVVISLLTAVAIFLAGRNRWLTNGLSVICSVINLFTGALLTITIYTHGPASIAFGQWPAPFGIVFVADLLSVGMVMVTAIIGLVSVIYAIADLSAKPSYARYHALLHVLLAGVYGAFLTGDIFNLYVWFEVMLIASFGLMVLDANQQQIDGAIKYVLLNLISTLVFLLSIGLLYGATGTLNLADLHDKAQSLAPEMKTMLAGLLLFAFSIKAALFPLFAWLPHVLSHLAERHCCPVCRFTHQSRCLRFAAGLHSGVSARWQWLATGSTGDCGADHAHWRTRCGKPI